MKQHQRNRRELAKADRPAVSLEISGMVGSHHGIVKCTLLLSHWTLVQAAQLILVLTIAMAASAQERVDLDAIGRIKAEGLSSQSQAMEILEHVADLCGPRLTGSPYRQPAADYVQKTLTDWGLAKVHTEAFPFGRGWAAERFSGQVISGQPWTLTGYAKAWTPGTKGTVRAEAVLAVIENESDMERLKGKLRGKFALIVPKRALKPLFDPVASRLSSADLGKLAAQPDPTVPVAFGWAREVAEAPFLEKLRTFLVNERVLCALDAVDRGLPGLTQVMDGGAADPKSSPVPCQVTLAAEHYNRLFRMLEHNVVPVIEMNVQNRFVDEAQTFNIVGEIPGTDKADEMVILGAHWDSWHAGTGGQDDGAGLATVMEAMRILKRTGLKFRRTIRVVLFDGEEEGLLGSQAYVREHVADPETMTLKPDQEKISLYLNVDEGDGLIRGLLLNGNEAIAPVFAKWMEAFQNLGMGLLGPKMTGGGDHVTFDAVGIPAFEFTQDPLEYRRTLHTNQDVFDRVQAADMMENAVIVASFAYQAANRDERMPRKPLPTAQQARDRWVLK